MTNCYKVITNFCLQLEMSVILIYNIEVNVRVVGYFLTAGITRRK